MYSGTEKFQAFHQRVASSSTKGRAGGLVEVLPPEARPWEQLFHSFCDQHRIALDKLTAAQVRLDLLYQRASEELPDDELTQVARDIRTTGQEIIHYRDVAEDLEKGAAVAAQNGVGFCFIAAARHALLGEQFEALMHTAQEMARGTGLMQSLPAPGPDPANRIHTARLRHMDNLLGDKRTFTLSASTLAIERAERHPPRVVIKGKRGAGKEPIPAVDESTAMQAAWTKAMRYAREAAVRALLRNEPIRKSRGGNNSVGRAQ
jgi:hypothetical protein